MELTKEQHDIINSDGNVKINAVAGSGKTTTLIEYAKNRDPKSKILYLAFNRTIKTKAIQKFTEARINNVRIETAHSLAFEHINKYKLFDIVPGYKNYEWCEILGIKTGDRMSDFILAKHVSRFLNYFCNSSALKIEDLNYLNVVTDPLAKILVKDSYDAIEKYTRMALAKMDKAEIAVTHDFYLKKYQLYQLVLPYDYILFDEGQDASGSILSFFLQQPANKIIVGDTNQQIYAWRYAINSLQEVDFPEYSLSKSFRFDDEIALFANKILGWKTYLDLPEPIKIIGAGNSSDDIKTRATIGRTNLSVLISAVTQWKRGKLKNLYFEGNINNYTFVDEGASLYDVLALYNGRKGVIRDKLIAEMATLKDLEEYIRKTEDAGLASMVDIVKEFGNDLPAFIDELRANQSSFRGDADMIFGTVHRCKGMEYDSVVLLDDFITEKKLKKFIQQAGDDKITETERNYLAEEINTLYVAVTRAKSKLLLPAELNPLKSIEFTPPELHISFNKTKFSSDYPERLIHDSRRENKFNRFDKRDNHGKQWTEEEVEKLKELYATNHSIEAIAKELGRGETGIRLKLYFTGLIRVQDML